MTSFAFILGTVPLAIALGAGAGARQAHGHRGRVRACWSPRWSACSSFRSSTCCSSGERAAVAFPKPARREGAARERAAAASFASARGLARSACRFDLNRSRLRTVPIVLACRIALCLHGRPRLSAPRDRSACRVAPETSPGAAEISNHRMVGSVPGPGALRPRANGAREQQGSRHRHRQRRAALSRNTASCAPRIFRRSTPARRRRASGSSENTGPPRVRPGGRRSTDFSVNLSRELRTRPLGQVAPRDRVGAREPARQRAGQAHGGADARRHRRHRLHPAAGARPPARNRAAAPRRAWARPRSCSACASRRARTRRATTGRPNRNTGRPRRGCPSSSGRSRSRRTSSACCSAATPAPLRAGGTSTLCSFPRCPKGCRHRCWSAARTSARRRRTCRRQRRHRRGEGRVLPDISLTGLLGSGKRRALGSVQGAVQDLVVRRRPAAADLQRRSDPQSGRAGRSDCSDEALSTYEKSIISAFQDVENALVDRAKFGRYAKSRPRTSRRCSASATWPTCATREGATIYLEVASAEQSLFNAQLAYVATQSHLFQSYANLYRAMGGGWVADAEKLAGAAR